MPNVQKDLIGTIEAIHAAGLDAQLWPDALAAMTRCVGGIAATIERYDYRLATIKEFLSYGIPPPNELVYLSEYAGDNPRVPVILASEPFAPVWDYAGLNERAMDRHSFYSDFLGPVGFRYYVGARLPDHDGDRVLVGVQRSAKQGHVDKAKIENFRRLLPHVQQAVDVARRLRTAVGASQSLEQALDWLTDGVALMRADGTILFANEVLRAMVRTNDGIRMRKNTIAFAFSAAQSRFGAAINAVRELREGNPTSVGDFFAARPSGGPDYQISVRPLLGNAEAAADLMVFVRDPSDKSGATPELLREAFGLTEAEANLARALQSGMSMNDYARLRGVSMTTVYTHMRRIKEKTGCNRMAELIHKFNELQMPLRRT
jgi:DNA-binding CsgD family transcriptional regulator